MEIEIKKLSLLALGCVIKFTKIYRLSVTQFKTPRDYCA